MAQVDLNNLWPSVRSALSSQTVMIQVCAVGVMIALYIIWWRR